MSAGQDSAEGSGAPRTRVGWMPMMITALLVIVVAMAGYFGLAYIKGSAFQEERAFRVLGEVSRQFDNLQGAMSSLLTLVPESLFREADCKVGAVDKDQYLAKLDLQGLKFESYPPSTTPAGEARSFRIDLDDPQRAFIVRADVDVAANGKPETSRRCLLEIRGSLQQHLPAFVAQRYFDQVLMTVAEGDVLATISGRSTDRSLIELHPDTSGHTLVTDARTLLLRGADILDPASVSSFWKTSAESSANDSTFPAPHLAVAFRQTIGGGNYVVSILPVTPAQSTRFVRQRTPQSVAPSTQPTLYLIGLKRENLSQQIADSLGPDGTLIITTVVLLGVLSWPFIGLRFSIPHAAISGFQVFAVMVSLTLIPVVLTTCVVWIWSTQKLQLWADRAAEHYAADIEDHLQSELSESAQLLAFYRKLAGTYPDCTRLDRAPLRLESGRRQIQYARVTDSPGDTVCRLLLRYSVEDEKTVLRNWSPLRTAVFLNAGGQSIQPRITAFGDVPARQHVDVSNREYVKALQEGQGWLVGRDSASGVRFVAQRLFNRSDAARVLQVAVPNTEAAEGGFIIADTRVYGLTAAVRPPLLRFAVINRDNAQVVFHSDDERSLSENFLVETELNPQLRSLLRTRSSMRRISVDDHFDGKYGGDSHRFHYRPLNGTPWSIAVFYPTRPLKTVALDAAIATLAMCIATITLVILLLAATAFLGSVRPDRQLLAAIWPQWEWRNHYPRVAIALTVAGGLLIAAFIERFQSGQWTSSAWMFAVLAILAAALVFVPRAPLRIEEPRLYRLFYSWSVVAFLGLAVVIPTAVLALRFQDVSTQTALTSALVQTAADIEQRERIMSSDLRRWVPSAADRTALYPDSDTLSRTLLVPGMSATLDRERDRRALWIVTAFHAMPWMDAAGPPQLGGVRRAIWRTTAATSPQQRRSGRAVSDTSGDAQEKNRASATTVQRIQRTVDGRTIRVLAVSDPHGTRIPLRRAPELDNLDQWSTVGLAATLGAMLLLLMVVLVSMTAQRLFGIYIPFGVRHLSPPDGRAFPFDELLAAELEIERMRAQARGRFTPKDAADMRRVLCEPRYRALWASLSADQRQLLHQLATGQYANPGNAAVIEELLYRGYIRLRPWPQIIDAGFTDFARTAPELAEFRNDRKLWAQEVRESTWNRVRKPVLLLGVLLAVGLMALAGSTLQILSTALAAIATLLGSVTQVTNFVRKDQK